MIAFTAQLCPSVSSCETANLRCDIMSQMQQVDIVTSTRSQTWQSTGCVAASISDRERTNAQKGEKSRFYLRKE